MMLLRLALPDDDRFAPALVPAEPTLWTCTNCGKQTTNIIFEEGNSNICRECYDTFEANESANRDKLPMTTDADPERS